MIEDLLPPEVACVELYSDDQFASLLFEEATQLGAAVENRVREFTTTRTCARRALSKLGIPETPILRGPYRDPLWPAGVVGSITHCEGFRAAVVGKKSDLLTVGIDAEIHEPLPAEVLHHICLKPEIAWLARAPKEIHWDRVLFSAKESIYKAWFPLTQRWLGFEDVAVAIRPVDGTFHAQLLVDSPVVDGQELREFLGQFMIQEELVLTATFLPRKPSAVACEMTSHLRSRHC
jgi:4'-phosphopantetheinyl transferase EntD